MRLTSTTLPAKIDPFGLVFTMLSPNGVVHCHVFRAAIDELEESFTRTDAEALRRFDRNRKRLEQVADRMFAAGHLSPWIGVEDLLLGVSPEDYED